MPQQPGKADRLDELEARLRVLTDRIESLEAEYDRLRSGLRHAATRPDDGQLHTQSRVAATDEPLSLDIVTYDLTAVDVARQFSKSIDWVRKHSDGLGGRKAAWKDGFRRPSTFRYPSEGLATRVAAVEQQMQANRVRRPRSASTRIASG